MAFLVCKLTPPRKGSEMLELTPSAFLSSEKAISPLKRKAHLNRLSSETLKRFRLDLEPITEDSTIIGCIYNRTQALLSKDRDKFYTYIPFEWELGQVRDL